MEGKPESVVLGGGCFWCVEAALALVPGVVKVTPGYAGGTTADPTYEEVCRGNTGHAEVALVEYDAGAVSLEGVLDVFFTAHDPTSLNRQGNDRGTQYRSIVLYASEEQKERVERFIEGIAGGFDRPVVTELKPLGVFYPAEDHHRGYYDKYPNQAYCQAVIAPKVRKVKKMLGQG